MLRAIAGGRYPVIAHFADRLHEVVGIPGLGDVALGADLDRARGEDRVVVHAEHDDPRRSVARQDAARQLKAGHGRQIDVDDADVGIFGGENVLATFGVRSFQDHHFRVVGEQARHPEATIG